MRRLKPEVVAELSTVFAEEEWWEDDAPVAMIPSSPPHDLGTGPLGEFILDLTCGVAKLTILLSEADDEEWPHIADRFGVFRSILAQLPLGPTRIRRKVGFVAPGRAAKRGKPVKKKQGRRKP